jgi:hypothetical protein
MYRRTGNKWTVNECLRLTREFELLGLSIQEIAELHERSPNAIMYKLDYEGIADYNDVFQNRQEKSCLSVSESEADDKSVSESDSDDKSVSESDSDDKSVSESEYSEEEDNDDAASENSEYIEAADNEDAASENSEYSEAAESEAAESEYNKEESISIYDVSQQIKNLTKQVSYLTKIVYNVFTDKNNPNAFKGHGLAGFH